MLTAVERLRLARELLNVQSELRGTTVMDPIRRLALARRVVSLRALITGQRVNSAVDLDLFAVADSTRVLRAHLEGLKDAGQDEQRRAGALVAIIAERISVIASSQGDQSASFEANGLISQARALAYANGEEDYFERVKEGYRQAGTDVVVALLPKLEAATNSIAEIQAKSKAVIEERDAAYLKANEELAALKRVARDRYEEVREGTLSHDEYRQYAERYNEAYRAATKELEARFNPALQELMEAEREAIRRGVEACEEFRAAMLEKSPVSQEQADAWANAQAVEASAKSALKRIGYELPKLRADMAEFYRMTGGRLAKVRIKASRGRASASDIHGYRNRTINMGERFSKRTLWHELGHHLEADPEVYAAAAGFLAARRESKELHRLSKLTGWKGYGPKEVAYRDHWYHPYVGKVYAYRVTEVISMGMEALSSGEALRAVMEKDPEHVRLMAGFIQSPTHPMFGTVKKVFEQAADAEAEADKVKESTAEDALKSLAEGVEFKPGEPPPTDRQPYTPGSQRKFVGWYHDLQLWSADKVKSYATKRARKGYFLTHAEDLGDRAIPRWRILSARAFSLDEAKAIARVWARSGELRGLPTDYRQLQQYAAAYAA